MRQAKLFFPLAGGVLLASLAACSTPHGPLAGHTANADQRELELTRPLEFHGRSARTYIQYGEPVRRNDVNEWQPYCSFGLNNSRDGKPLVREIRPTVFTVRGAESGVDMAWNDDSTKPGGLIAGRGRMVATRSGGTPWPYNYYTRMDLYAEDQPQVDDLTCHITGGPPKRGLSPDDIQDALGGIARID